jgi:ATPase subunit of ABC transporter with duplicated ATPase domains
MEIDPLKVPAFMRNKPYKKGGISSYFKPSKPSTTSIPTPLKPTTVKRVKPEPVLTLVGVVTHHIDKINVAIVKLGADVQTGDRLQLVGKNGPFKQKLKSMQIDRESVEIATGGQEVGIKVNKKVVTGEMVYLVS